MTATKKLSFMLASETQYKYREKVWNTCEKPWKEV